MLRRAGNIITYFVLAALLLLSGTAREFVHAFAAHEDTVDIPHNHAPGKTFFEKEHHHCDFLDLALAEFDHIAPGFPLLTLPTHIAYYPFSYNLIRCGKILTQFDRGPPFVYLV